MLSPSRHAPSSPVLWILWCSHSLTMLYMLQVLQCSGFLGALTLLPCSKSSTCSTFSSALGSLMLSLSHHALHAPGSPVLCVFWCSHSLTTFCMLQVLQCSEFSAEIPICMQYSLWLGLGKIFQFSCLLFKFFILKISADYSTEYHLLFSHYTQLGADKPMHFIINTTKLIFT